MSVSPLDLLDEDPLGLFINDTKRKKQRRRKKNLGDIFEQLGLNDNEEYEHDKSFLFKDDQSKLFVKTVEFSKDVQNNDAVKNKSGVTVTTKEIEVTDSVELNEKSAQFTLSSAKTHQVVHANNLTLDECSLLQSNKSLFIKPQNVTKEAALESQKVLLRKSSEEKLIDKEKEKDEKSRDPSVSQDQQTLHVLRDAISAVNDDKCSTNLKIEEKQIDDGEEFTKVSHKKAENYGTREINQSSLYDNEHPVSKRKKPTSRPVSVLDNKANSVSTPGSPRHAKRDRPKSTQLPTFNGLNKFGETINDAATVRMMSYQMWCADRRHRRNSSTGDQKKKEVDNEKVQMNEKAFQAWRAQKRKFFLDQIRKRKEEEEERKRKAEEMKEKQKSCEKAFEIWRNKKDAERKELVQKMQAEHQKIEEIKAKECHEKKANSDTAFLIWKEKKEAQLRESMRNKRKTLEENERKKEEEHRTRLERAAQAYFQWEARKLIMMGDLLPTRELHQTQSVENLHQNSHKIPPSPERAPWRPPSSRATTRSLIP